MAREDIQRLLDSQPPVLPAEVARVKADGTPTTHLMDWELFQTSWFKGNIIATDSRLDEVKATADNVSASVTVETNARVAADEALAEQITTVQASVGDVAASVTNEITARANADTALSGQITTVQATASGATANGQVFLAATAGPAGSTAAYGWYLTAGATFTGMEAIARSDGTSAIGFRASQFYFTDSGTAKDVFTYSGGKFRFTGDVAIDGDLLVNGTVKTDHIQSNAITTQKSSQGTVSGADVSLTFTTTGADANCILLISYEPQLGSGLVGTDSPVWIDGSVVFTLNPTYVDGTLYPQTFHRVATVAAKGTHSLLVEGVQGGRILVTIMTFNK